MLSSNRTTMTRAGEPEETDLWESLRVEAGRRSSEFPAASRRSVPPPVPMRASSGYPSSQQPSPFAVSYPAHAAQPAPHDGFGRHDEYAQADYFEIHDDTVRPAPYSAYAPTPAPTPAFDAQAWARNFEAPAYESIEATAPRARSRLLVPVVVLASMLGMSAAAYQFVLLPRQAQERAVALAALDEQQRKLAEEQQALQEANARAEDEQRAATEAEARADAAAAAAAAAAGEEAVQSSGAQDQGKITSGGSGSSRERRARARAERHERRAAARARRHERREKAASAHRASSKSKSSRGAGTDSEDPLFGL